MLAGERFVLAINNLVVLLLSTTNDLLSACAFHNLLIEIECKLRSRQRQRALAPSKGRFSMQSVFIKTNWPWEIQKDLTVPFFLF